MVLNNGSGIVLITGFFLTRAPTFAAADIFLRLQKNLKCKPENISKTGHLIKLSVFRSQDIFRETIT